MPMKDSCIRFDHLIKEDIDGLCSKEDSALLEEHLETCTECMQKYAQSRKFEDFLTEMLPGEIDTESFGLQLPLLIQRASTAKKIRVFLKAASFLLVCGFSVYLYLSGPVRERSTAIASGKGSPPVKAPSALKQEGIVPVKNDGVKLVESKGTIMCRSDRGDEILELNDICAFGSRVMTGKGDTGTMMYPCGTKVKFFENTEYIVDMDSITIKRGGMIFNVVKRSGRKEFSVTSPVAVCGVLGTVFKTVYNPSKQRFWVKVQEGRVKLHNARGSVVLGPKETGSAGYDGIPGKVQPKKLSSSLAYPVAVITKKDPVIGSTVEEAEEAEEGLIEPSFSSGTHVYQFAEDDFNRDSGAASFVMILRSLGVFPADFPECGPDRELIQAARKCMYWKTSGNADYDGVSNDGLSRIDEEHDREIGLTGFINATKKCGMTCEIDQYSSESLITAMEKGDKCILSGDPSTEGLWGSASAEDFRYIAILGMDKALFNVADPSMTHETTATVKQLDNFALNGKKKGILLKFSKDEKK